MSSPSDAWRARVAALRPSGPGFMDERWAMALIEELVHMPMVSNVLGAGTLLGTGYNQTITITPPNLLGVYAAIANALTTAEEYTDSAVAAALVTAEAYTDAAVAVEAARAIAAEAALEVEIAAEVTRATAAEAALEAEIVIIEGEIVTIEAEIVTLTAGEATLTAAVAAIVAEIYDFYNNAGYDNLPDVGTALYDLYTNANVIDVDDLATLGTVLHGIFRDIEGLPGVDSGLMGAVYSDPITGYEGILFDLLGAYDAPPVWTDIWPPTGSSRNPTGYVSYGYDEQGIINEQLLYNSEYPL